MKKFLSLTLSIVMLWTLFIPAYAAESESLYVNESEIELVDDDALMGNYSEATENRLVNDFFYRKTNVTTTKEWSAFKRVSDNVITNNSGGSISATKSVTFGTEVSGNISGLGISVNASVSSEIGHTINVDPNKRVYMGYRVRYEVERGTREYYDIVTGKVIRSNKYTVKKPLFGEYKLINYHD